jgi:hypothetical protein
MAKRKTITERLLNEVEKRGGMTPQEFRATALYFAKRPYCETRKDATYELRQYRASGYYDAQLYGTRDRLGLVGRYLRQKKDGTLVRTAKPATGPFYPFRKDAERRESAKPVAERTTSSYVDPFDQYGDSY